VCRISLYSFRRRLEPAMTGEKDVGRESEEGHRKVAFQHERERTLTKGWSAVGCDKDRAESTGTRRARQMRGE
jgi:hypothetical protein